MLEQDLPGCFARTSYHWIPIQLFYSAQYFVAQHLLQCHIVNVLTL